LTALPRTFYKIKLNCRGRLFKFLADADIYSRKLF
jgi:hypothetical protein